MFIATLRDPSKLAHLADIATGDHTLNYSALLRGSRVTKKTIKSHKKWLKYLMNEIYENFRLSSVKLLWASLQNLGYLAYLIFIADIELFKRLTGFNNM